MNKKMVKNGKATSEGKQYAGREILMAMNLLEDGLLEIQTGTEEKKQRAIKKNTAGKFRWAVAALCSFCLVGGGVALAASLLNWHVEKYVDTNNPQPDYLRYWVDFKISPVPVDTITGPVREVENIFKEEAANGIYPPDGCPRGWVTEELTTEREAIDYVGYGELRETMLPDWKNWHCQLAAYGDEEGNLEPYSEEEVERRARVAEELCETARDSRDLKEAAEAIGLTPIESSVGIRNEGDGQEPRMLDAARLLEVGEISDPVQTEEGWFLVQHTSDYDEEGTDYWREYLTRQAREEEYERIYEAWKEEADISFHQEIMDQADVEIVLKELL